MQADETLAFGGEFLDRTNLIGASDAAQESTGASRHIPAHQTASAFNSPFKARSAVRRFVIETGLVVVKLIALAEALRRKIRHHDVAAVFDAHFASVVTDGLKRRGGGNIDRPHDETRHGDHIERKLQKRLRLHLPERLEVIAFALQVRSHADHVHVKLLERTNVAAEVFERLTRNADHHARAELVPRTAQTAQTFETVLEILFVGAGG